MIPSAQALHDLIAKLLLVPSAVQSEVVAYYRIDKTKISDDAVYRQLISVAQDLGEAGVGRVSVFGELAGELDLVNSKFSDVDDEVLTIIFEKATTKQSVFVTEAGFLRAVQAESDFLDDVVWVAADFDEFATHSMLVVPWGGPVARSSIERGGLLSPRKLVRDHTHRLTPARIEPWLLLVAPKQSSEVFARWKDIATEQLSFCLPFEIIATEDEVKVILKGPRSQDISVGNDFVSSSSIFDHVTEAAAWIYSSTRDAETRFMFLNYHLSLDWRSGELWPTGLDVVVPTSLVAAREAFAFHLQDKSKDVLKSLADLRKSLQDDVSKTQQSTRDLVSSLWRDFAIAAGVLALRYLPGTNSIPAVWLKIVTLSSAVLLLVSISVTIWSNCRFNGSARRGREDWRSRIYGFVEPKEWERLVVVPLRQATTTYRCVASVIVVMYTTIIGYLVYLSAAGSLFLSFATTAWMTAKRLCAW